ncbi:uncharacterized protein LOC107037624 isoform X2 [Diachasma alloeum]|uniref:uncharacterized protein LOC107037624 isoform X2 n=1 Tax=Diachasma alloeum TaxID=454923 RepID=UPI000738402A|nr:uncharacterized protein LOC107037624 isoform X2 [Diachasma alloeum]
MAKKPDGITEEILRIHTDNCALLGKSLATNARIDSAAEQDQNNRAFFETLIPELRNVRKEDILLCRNDVSRVIFKYAYKDATWKSINDGPMEGSSAATSTSLSSRRKRERINDDNDCQIK